MFEFLSNYGYSKKIESTRADYLIYNLENYLIRLNSVYDRVLQIVNAVFHLCINEENVNHSVIISNYKVQHNVTVHNSIWSVESFPQFTLIQDKDIGQPLEIIEFVENRPEFKNINDFKQLCKLSTDQIVLKKSKSF